MDANCASRRWRPAFLPVVALLVLSLALPTLGAAQTPGTLVPVGGGYESTTLQEFSRVVIEQASAPIVDIYVLPSSYGDNPDDREENIELAQERTDQIEAECNAVVDEYDGFTGCEATLLILFDREDALDPANSDPVRDPDADGVWILGGDQTIAMHVLAESPAEDALEEAYLNGVVFGGTSAGAAVESTSMLAGYTADGWPYNALERPMIVIWWSNDGDDERGLRFTSENVAWDQHFYERGRFTRLFNVVAQSDEQFGGDSLLGVGIDWGTSAMLEDDTWLSRVAGETSAGIIDFETLRTTYEWVGERETLSARDIVTHILPAGDEYAYDVTTRTMYLDGDALETEADDWDSGLLGAPGRATLILGGDLLWDDSAPVWDEFLNRTGPQARPIVIVSAGYGDAAANLEAAQDYESELRANGWQGEVRILPHGDEAAWAKNPKALIGGAAGVVVVGGHQSMLESALADSRFTTLLSHAVKTAPVVLTDRAVTSVMGEWYAHEPEPTSGGARQTVASTSFLEGGVEIREGLGIIEGASFQSLFTYNQHWGRAYQLAAHDPDAIVFGVSELTALVLDGDDAYVAGERSVISFDGRNATFTIGDNSALGAFNVIVDLFAPGDDVAS